MLKNTASQKWSVFAFDRTDNTPKTGDAANITANLRLDGGAANAIDDTNPTELEDGFYIFDITQAECNADHIVICPSSTTANIQVIGTPMATWTTVSLADDAITASKYDESTAFPIKSADTGSTQIARTGADSDTLETLSDQLDATGTSGEIADDVWNEVIETAHEQDGSAGEHLNALAKGILARTNTKDLNGLLGVADTATKDVPAQVWDEAT
ncbi:MAG: hypothetical protein ACYTBZ_28205, partial [Planctomycetota bacterium]